MVVLQIQVQVAITGSHTPDHPARQSSFCERSTRLRYGVGILPDLVGAGGELHALFVAFGTDFAQYVDASVSAWPP
jgi:hypothetical protein